MNELTLEQQVKNIINDPKLRNKEFKICELLIGKKVRIKELHWYPGNKYSGRILKIERVDSSCNGNVYFVYGLNSPAFDLLKDIEIIE